MQVSFKFDETKGFVTDTPGKNQILLKNSLSNHTENFAPTELLLLAMGGCTSDDVLSILKKMRADFEAFRCEITAERNEEHPRTIKKAVIHYIFTGSIDPDKARKAIILSLTKYCSVSILARRGGADVRYSLTIDGNRIDYEVDPEAVAETA